MLHLVSRCSRTGRRQRISFSRLRPYRGAGGVGRCRPTNPLVGKWHRRVVLERVRVHSLQSVRGSSMGHCPKELSGAASPHTSLPTAASDGFFRWLSPPNRRNEIRARSSGASSDISPSRRAGQMPNRNSGHDRSCALMGEPEVQRHMREEGPYAERSLGQHGDGKREG